MLQRDAILPPQASKRCALETPVSAWWPHGGSMLNKPFDAPRFFRGVGRRTDPRRAGSLRKNHFLPVRGSPRRGSTLTTYSHFTLRGFFPRNPAVPGVRKSRPRLRPARLSGSARRGIPAAGAVSGTPRRGIPFRALQKSGFPRGFQG